MRCPWKFSDVSSIPFLSGCPFKHWDPDVLAPRLRKYGVAQSAINEVSRSSVQLSSPVFIPPSHRSMGLVRITSWYPEFNGSHFGLPPNTIHQMTGLGGKMV